MVECNELCEWGLVQLDTKDIILAIVAVAFTVLIGYSEISRIRKNSGKSLSRIFSLGIIFPIVFIANNTLQIVLAVTSGVFIMVLILALYIKYKEKLGLNNVYIVRLIIAVVLIIMYTVID